MMITGKPPFQGSDDREIIRKVRLGKFSMNCKELSDISDECKDFIKRLLTIDPK